MAFRRGRGVPLDIQQHRVAPAKAREPIAQPVVLPKHIEPPSGARKLFLSGRDTLAMAVNAQVTPDDLILQLGNGEEATLQFFKMFVDQPTVDTDILWSVNLDDAPVAGLERLTVQGRTGASSIEQEEEIRLEVPRGRKISVTITSRDGLAAYVVGAQLTGWRTLI